MSMRMWQRPMFAVLPRGVASASAQTQRFSFSSAGAEPVGRRSQSIKKTLAETKAEHISDGASSSGAPIDRYGRRYRQSSNAGDACVFVQALVAKLEKNKYEVFRLPRCSRGSFLIRVRGDGNEDQASASDRWQAIRVKSARRRYDSAAKRYFFCGSGGGPRPDVGLALVCTDEEMRTEFVHFEDIAVEYAGGPQYWFRRGDIKASASEDALTRASVELERVLSRIPKRSLSEWLAALATREQDHVRQ
ncbi:unnamed protein product [Amoebophrya sp. A25]|nr:unnamed protein product [Amoebophrya sp. A25]|eukprot:GSA25T00009148001.1